MSEDGWMFVVVFVVWTVLALGYAFVPMFHMPGYASVWGWGALVFFALAVAIAAASREHARRAKRSRTPETESASGK